MAKKVIRLTESDMNRLIRKIVKEQDTASQKPAQVPTSSSQTQVSEDMNYLLNYLDANGLIKVREDKYKKGQYMVIVGNEKDTTNYLMDWIAKLTDNNMSDVIIAWCNKSQKWSKYKISNVQITREYYPD